MSTGVKGLDGLRAKLRNLGPNVKKLYGKALYEEAALIEGVSAERTPVDLGPLKGSHETGAPEITKDKVSVTIRVGGPAAPYAVAVHEHLSEHSPPSWQAAERSGRGVHFTSGGPKFLESAVNERKDDLAQRLQARVDLSEAL